MPMTLETEPLADQQAEAEQTENPTVTLYGGGMEDETIEQEGATDVSYALGTSKDESTTEGESVSADDGDKPAAEIEPQPEQPQPIRIKETSGASETLAKISEAASEVGHWREAIALLKDELKEAKENLQGAVNRLMRLSAASANDEKRPLLAAAESKAESASTVDTAAAGEGQQTNESDASPAAATADKDAWRAYRLDDSNHFPLLASQKAIIAKLAENGIETIGHMVDFQSAANGNKEITDIKGIGSGKAAKIADAMEVFWAEHPELTQAAVDAS